MKIPAGMLENLDKLIELETEKTRLLIQFKKSLIYQSCTYHLVKMPGNRYSLIEIETKLSVSYGSLEEVNSYLKRRNIDDSIVYKD